MWKFTFDMLNALNAAQERSISHRDIKPSNVFVDINGATPIGDWGEVKDN